MNHKTLLLELKSCAEVVGRYDNRDSEQAWAECHRGHWMLWIAERLGIDRKLLVLAACDCVDRVLQFIPADESRPREAVETARAWCAGKATMAEVRAAVAAAYGAVIAVDTSAAISAASYAADSAYAAISAAHIAADAYAVVHSVAYAAFAAGVKSAEQEAQADIVRRHIPWDTICRLICRLLAGKE